MESQINVHCNDFRIELISNIKYVKIFRQLHFLELIFKKLSGTSRCIEDCLFVVDINLARRAARNAYSKFRSQVSELYNLTFACSLS